MSREKLSRYSPTEQYIRELFYLIAQAYDTDQKATAAKGLLEPVIPQLASFHTSLLVLTEAVVRNPSLVLRKDPWPIGFWGVDVQFALNTDSSDHLWFCRGGLAFPLLIGRAKLTTMRMALAGSGNMGDARAARLSEHVSGLHWWREYSFPEQKDLALLQKAISIRFGDHGVEELTYYTTNRNDFGRTTNWLVPPSFQGWKGTPWKAHLSFQDDTISLNLSRGPDIVVLQLDANCDFVDTKNHAHKQFDVQGFVKTVVGEFPVPTVTTFQLPVTAS